MISLFDRIFSEPLGMSEFSIFDVALILTVVTTTIAILPMYIRIMRRIMPSKIFSDREIRKQLDSYEITQLETKIRKEKNKEKKLELKEQETRLREEFEATYLQSLRGDDGKISSDWREVLLLSRSRLLNEFERLSARSSANLLNGIWISIAAIILLLFVLFFLPPKSLPDNWFGFASTYGSRFFLVGVVQVLGIFFLRLYVGNEKDIQKNKNEITNIELRIAAGLMAKDSKVQLAKLSEKLISEERNFILLKGENAVSLDGKETTNSIEKLANLISARLKDL